MTYQPTKAHEYWLSLDERIRYYRGNGWPVSDSMIQGREQAKAASDRMNQEIQRLRNEYPHGYPYTDREMEQFVLDSDRAKQWFDDKVKSSQGDSINIPTDTDGEPLCKVTIGHVK